MTFTAIANRMGITRENLWRLRRRHPGLDGWISEQLATGNEHLVGPVVRKMAMLGLRGSVDHAELFLKHVTGNLGGAAPAGGPTFNGPTVINLAVPRPGDPPVHASLKMIPQAVDA